LVFILLVLQFPVGVARASMVSTERLLATSETRQERKRILTFLAREDVEAKLVALGVAPAEARERVKALSDAEARQAAAQIDQLPAGQGAAGTIAVVILIGFLVLLFTDLIGATDVFPFVKKTRKK
jgi:hypothetical protein